MRSLYYCLSQKICGSIDPSQSKERRAMQPADHDDKKKLVVHVPVKGVEQRLDKLTATLGNYMGSDHDIRDLIGGLSNQLQGLSQQVGQLKKEVAALSHKADGMNGRINAVEQTVLATGKGIGVLTKHLKVAHVDSCPECGSSVSYTATMGGEMGACNVCGWSHFLD